MHALPALTDASKVYPEIQFDWIVDESFSSVPSWNVDSAETTIILRKRIPNSDIVSLDLGQSLSIEKTS